MAPLVANRLPGLRTVVRRSEINGLAAGRDSTIPDETVRNWDEAVRRADGSRPLCGTFYSMARGWESKSVESQQDDARSARHWQHAPALSPEDRRRAERRTTLRLAVAQAQAELQAACRSAHRDMIRLKLDALQQELRVLESGDLGTP